MWHWLNENKDWLFSGVGVALATVLIGAFTRKRSHRGSRQSQRAGRGSFLFQVANLHIAGKMTRDDNHIATSVVDFLADRRVLTQPIDRENPQYCVQSAIQIREKLSLMLEEIEEGSSLRQPVLRIREAANRFCSDAEAYLAAGGNLWTGLPLQVLNIDSVTGERTVIKTFDNRGVPDFEDSLTVFRKVARTELGKIQKVQTREQ